MSIVISAHLSTVSGILTEVRLETRPNIIYYSTMNQLMKLTRKQKAFADKLIDNPKMSATQAILQTYNVKSEGSTARTVAAQNLAKPSIQAYLDKHDYESQTIIVKTMKQTDDKRLAYDAARDIQDRLHGKAKQSIETTTTGVTLTIDLTSALTDTD